MPQSHYYFALYFIRHSETVQCCGSMAFWCGSRTGSGTADPCHWLMDPDSAIFVTDLQDANKKLFLKKVFCIYFLKIHLHHFSKIKSQNNSQSSRYQGFSYSFCLVIEGSGSGSIPLTMVPDADPEGPKTYGSDGSVSATLRHTIDIQFTHSIIFPSR